MSETDTTEAESETNGNESTADRRTTVRERYGDIAAGDGDCCGPTCCGDGDSTERNERDPLETQDADARSLELGYDRTDLEEAPEGANLGLGCGNPVAISNLEPGETVLDLGSGGGFDCFLAAREVSPGGRVIGVDMTPEMLERARENAAESDLADVDLEFRLGEIEHLPVPDESVDVIISNCVLNLSPEKPQVLAEAFRTLRPGGRLSISDLVATEPLPPAVRDDPDLVSGCVGGAAMVDDLETWLADAGFEDVSVTVESTWDGEREYDGDQLPIASARIEGRKPAR